MAVLYAVLIFGGVTLIALGFRPFADGFQTRFGRGYFHLSVVLSMALFVLAAAYWNMNNDSFALAVIFFVSLAVLIDLGIWQMMRYGFLWGLGSWFYSILTVVLVVSVIHWIASLFSGKRKR